MSTARISRASAAPGVMLALLIAAGCVPDRLSGPPAGEASLAASAFSGKKFQLTNGTVCGASSPTKEFDQSLDESITGVNVTGFLPFGAQWEATAGGGNPADIGHFEFICGGFPNLYHLVSDVAGRVGTHLSAGGLAVGTYTIRVLHAGKVLARGKFEVVL